MCIYLLKETIGYYKHHNTTLFISLIYASKAFDWINQWTLFHKLITRGVPVYIVREFFLFGIPCNRWKFDRVTMLLNLFMWRMVSNRVEFWHALFILYMDELSVRLSKLGFGARLAGNVLNHLGYADDLCLLSLINAVMQRLLPGDCWIAVISICAWAWSGIQWKQVGLYAVSSQVT